MITRDNYFMLLELVIFRKQNQEGGKRKFNFPLDKSLLNVIGNSQKGKFEMETF
jgi:hypothetical protein